jgi:transposase
MQAVYRAWLPEYMEEGGEFMHNGAGPHRGNLVKEALAEIGIQVMVLPLYSPDLNPIENLWALIKAEIYKLHPELEHALDINETLDALIEAAKEA